MKVEPQKEHRWLQKLVGEWVMQAEAATEPGKPLATPWVETFRSLHGVGVVGAGRGEMPEGGGQATTIMTLGYDTRRRRYVGTWVGSMMDHLWVYDGELDAAGRVLTLHTEGPNFADGGKTMTKFKDIIEFKADDHRTLTAEMLGPDGKWSVFMTSSYRRKK